MKEENLSYKNSKGHSISAILSTVSEDKDIPVIIVAHGFTSSKNGSAREISEILADKGINALRFDFNGHGESEGLFEDVTVSEGVEDILAGVNYLKTQGFKRIGLLGTSYGGACSIIAASKSRDLYLLVLRSPAADFYTRELMTKTKKELEEWKSMGFRMYKRNDGSEKKLNYSFFEDMKNNDGFKSGGQISVPTFVVHGDKDDRVPLILSEMLVKVIPNSELKIIEGADHTYSDPKLDEQAVNEMINFIVNKS